MKKYFTLIFIILGVIFFLVREIFFVSEFGGIEHDSGWYLGVARNFAQRGIYASYTNTIIPEGEGAFPSLHARFSVQDRKGFSYFPAGVSAGPGYIIPEALILKILGSGLWQYRLWPLIAFAGLIFLIFIISYKLGGKLSLVLIVLWMWITPQLTLQFSYEAYGEHIALFYLLGSFYFLYLSGIKNKRKIFLFGISGFLFALAITTKFLMLMNVIVFGIVFLIQILQSRNRKSVLKNWGVWLFLLLLPIFSFEVYKYVFLVSNFGGFSWEAVNKDFLIHFKSNGSGVDLKSIDWGFIPKKLGFWEDVGLKPVPSFLLVLSSPIFFLKKKMKKELSLNLLLYLSFIVGSFWFVFISPTGWDRHVWHTLVIGMIIFIFSLSKILEQKFGYLFLAFFTFIIFSSSFLVRFDKFNGNFFFRQEDIDLWYEERYQRGLQGLPSNPIISLEDQKDLQKYFSKNIEKEDRVYYAGWFLVAEASPLADKVFFSLDRYFWLDQKNPEGGVSYLILGPYQKGKYSIVGTEYHDKKVGTLCDGVVFENPSYTLCVLRGDLVYRNEAYD